MPAFKRDSASRLRDAERCMKGGEPLTMRAEPWSDSLTANPGQRLTVPDSLTALTALSLTEADSTYLTA